MLAGQRRQETVSVAVDWDEPCAAIFNMTHFIRIREEEGVGRRRSEGVLALHLQF